MHIYFYDVDLETEEHFASCKLDANPYFIGQITTIQVNNKRKDIWDVEDLERTKYMVVDIKSDLIINYGDNNCHEHFSLYVYLRKV